MSLSRLAAAPAAVLGAALLASCGGHKAAPTIVGTVGPGAKITLTDGSGDRVRTLKPGKYVFVIHDRSTVDDFHLVGPTVDLRTSLGGEASPSWDLTMSQGTYQYFSDSHAVTLAGSFRVS